MCRILPDATRISSSTSVSTCFISGRKDKSHITYSFFPDIGFPTRYREHVQ
jgi:hypothetical protein